MTASPCVIAAAEHAGWAHLVCVAAPRGVPSVIDRRKVTLIGDGLPTMPYHHESLGLQEEAANALIARVRRSIAGCTSRVLREVVTSLAPSHAVVALAIRESPFPELPDTVAPVRASYRLQCAADGMMYQLALRHEAREIGLEIDLCRRGEETSLAAQRLGVRPGEIESFVSRTRPPGPPWTTEHRRAYAAGIAALAPRARRGGAIQLR
jgi:hypothetical protein